MMPLSLVPVVLGLLIGGAHAEVEGGPHPGMPSQAECPECAFGTWTCPRESCTGEENYRRMAFTFNYHGAGCREDIPVDRNSVQMDVDVACLYGDLAFNCTDMHQWRFVGMSMLGGCMPDGPVAASIVNETCHWVCKAGRVIARCIWAFDQGGNFQDVGGSMDRCWLEARCGADSRTEVAAACRPTELWTTAQRTAAELSNARADYLASAAQLQEAQQSHGDITTALQRYTASQEGLSDLLDQVQQTLAQPTGNLDATTAAERQQVAQQLAAIITDLNSTLQQLGDESSAHDSTRQELDTAMAAYTALENQLREATVQYNSEQVQANETNDRLVFEIQDWQSAFENMREMHEDQKQQVLWLKVTIGALCFLVVLLVCVGCVLMRMHKLRLGLALARAQEPVPSDGGVMVVGRPVGDGVEPTTGKGGAPGHALPNNAGSTTPTKSHARPAWEPANSVQPQPPSSPPREVPM